MKEPAGLLEERDSNPEMHKVRFEYFNPDACEVLVAGSFNDWQGAATPMACQGGGIWCAEVLLKPGSHEYRFVVDGQWLDDSKARRSVANPFGGLNCVVDVAPLAPSAICRT